jgi:DHA1 family bicyclomycin/chloramphenicol resistance-like MFS transporter
MGMVVAPMLAPAVGGYLDVWFGWRATFVFALVFGALVAAGVLRVLHETRQPVAGESLSLANLLAGFAHLMRVRAFRGYAFQGAFSVGVFFAFVGGTPYIMAELLNRPPNEYGLYFIGVAASFMAGNFIAGRLSPVVGIDRMITLGSFAALTATVILCIVMTVSELTPLLLFGSMAGVGLGNGMSVPNSLAGVVSVDPSRAGAAAGFSGFLQMTMGAATSYIVGLLLSNSAWPMVIAMTLAAVLSLISHLLGQRAEKS